ncbi:uncharacterized protein DUF3892 [Homoserinimonas aerilata]|uniref:Uncharacterized protein DUF3892 n=1 Tax=Homoserinimonas aerilata TaxID=1162970 RepID=A0A542YGF8_9MICO|nr:DUF3892 domain-containing protein [Homoserinimonas aerilata]TQL47157.1 uncharacterized protein DUF3892 [Homoserinimonas aerilata]
MLYIRQVRVEAPGTLNQHITDVKYSATTGGPLTTVSRAAVVSVIDGGGIVFTHNDHNRAQARVVTRVGTNGRKHITTIADSGKSNNLLELPRF